MQIRSKSREGEAMKVAVIGATGTIGKALVNALSGRHEVIRVTRRIGVKVDIEDKASIQAMYENVKPIDAVVSCAGNAAFRPLVQLTDENFELGLRSKLMGQVNLVRLGLEHVRDGGSFTLTGGILAHEPMPGGAAISIVNAALEGFARGASVEMPRGLRVNVVSPPWISETLVQLNMDPSVGIAAAAAAKAYVAAIEGKYQGETLDARKFA
jgi:NAD(P)-dependent dehydrogenase (short-subunit alcohol dehydrogenase family)